MEKEKPYIPRTGDLIVFADFNDAVGMIVSHSSVISPTQGRLVIYKFLFPDIKPFRFVEDMVGGYSIFKRNHLRAIFRHPINNNTDIVVNIEDLREVLTIKKWVVKRKNI